MKIITFAIPSYNSQDYMEKCINSLLPGGEDVEILIVDDGSTDRTGEIADDYAARYPGICRAIHQPNGGHGEAVNAGLRNAQGIYYKVVDSDDWVDPEAYVQVLSTLKRLVRQGTPVDMLLTNYVYEKVHENTRRRMVYSLLFPQNKVIGWNEMKHNIKGFTILMHSVTYRTQMLRDCGLELPKHTFYVDNLFVYEPLPHVKKIYYLNQNLYHYYIGREDQSVNETVMISRLDQQYRVNRLMIECCDVLKVQPKKLRKYMILYLEIITTVSSVLSIKSGTEENLQRKKELWAELREKHFPLWWRMRSGFLGQGVNLPGKIGNKLTILAYKLTQKFYGFN